MFRLLNAANRGLLNGAPLSIYRQCRFLSKTPITDASDKKDIITLDTCINIKDKAVMDKFKSLYEKMT